MKFRIYTVCREEREKSENAPAKTTTVLGDYLIKAKARKAELKEIEAFIDDIDDHKVISAIHMDIDETVIDTTDGLSYAFYLLESEVIV